MKRPSISVAVVVSVAFLVLAVTFSNCSPAGFKASSLSSTSGASNGSPPSTNPPSTSNSASTPIPIVVGGMTNQPMVSVTICQPGTANCATIPNLLLDTGSSGLRIFSSALTASLYSQLPGNGFGTCISYGDNSIQWGPVKTADVRWANQVAASVPIQIVDNTFGDKGATCLSAVKSELQNAGIYDPRNPPYFDSPASNYNGILGVNFLIHDCGAPCATYPNNEIYFTCSGNSCTSSTATLSQQVVNPISLFPGDNNGLTIKVPAPINGIGNNMPAQAFLGIGTNSDNTPAASGQLSVLTADPNYNDDCYSFFQTLWNGNKICGFFDSGSNSLVFPNSTSTPIAIDSNDFYVPASLTSLSATNIGFNGASYPASFSVANIDSHFNVNNVLQYWGIEDVGGPLSGYFDWGFPFFMGRTVYIGLEGRSSSLGNGLYWAY